MRSAKLAWLPSLAVTGYVGSESCAPADAPMPVVPPSGVRPVGERLRDALVEIVRGHHDRRRAVVARGPCGHRRLVGRRWRRAGVLGRLRERGGGDERDGEKGYGLQ